ncbi:MAG: Ig-like domain-containing protein [Ahniella sp.]|nr:Ig-like domain-containing protein [Ahniella sp.]
MGSPGQAYAIHAHQSEPDTRPPTVGFHIPRAGQTNYPLGAPISVLIHETIDTLSIVNGDSMRLRRITGPGTFGPPLAGRWTFSFDDVLTFQPTAPLTADATYEMRLNGIRDAAGNPMPAYAWTFSTGGSVGGNRPPVVDLFTATPYPAAPGQPVMFGATGADPDADSLEYRFDFGDGSVRTDWSSNSSANHPYSAAGHWRTVVQVVIPSGAIASRSRVVTVVAPLPVQQPTASSPILCDSPRRRVWTVNPDASTISVLDADSLAKLAEYPTCSDPRAIARAPSGQLWVTCHDDDRIRIHDDITGGVLATIDTGYGSGPVGVAHSPNGATAYVTLGNRGELRRFDTVTRQQTGSLALGPHPRGVAVSADGTRVLVSRFRSPSHHAEVWDVHAGTFTLTRAIRIPKQGNDQNRDTTASGRGVANQLAAITLSPRNGHAFVPATKPNNERGQLIHPSQDLDQDNTVRNLLVELNPLGASPAERFRRAIDIDNSDSASAVAFSPLGDYVLVTLQGMDELLVLDALALESQTGLGALVTRLPTGAAPQGVCSDAATGRTFVHNFMDRSVTMLDTHALFTAGALQASATTVDMVLNEPLPPNVLTGKRIFYNASDPRMSAEGYLSCATCHVDGADDGRTWDFTGRGEGLRNTTVLNGRGGLTHGRVHWSANFDEIQDFENDIRNAFGGIGFLSDPDFALTENPLGTTKAGRNAELDALAAYVSSLGDGSLPRSPFRLADGSATALGIQGETIFQREQCGSCHTPPNYTTSAVGTSTLLNVGTIRASSGSRLGGALTGIDPPTLRGVFDSAPYFHNGSAPTLDAVFRWSGGITLPAENAGVTGGAQLINTFVELNNDDLVRGRSFVQLEDPNHRLTFSNVDGGPGGIGALELRYSNSRSGGQTQALTVRLNGVTLPVVQVPASDNDPSFRSTNWSVLRVESIALNAGASNIIELSTNNWYLAIDEVLVAHAGHLAQAQPHRRVAGLPTPETEALLAFLRELDGSPAIAPGGVLFANGFED